MRDYNFMARTVPLINGFVMACGMVLVPAVLCSTIARVAAGPYTEAGINGYVGPDRRHASPQDPNAVLNPIFRGWASGVKSYLPSPQYIEPWWKDPTKALGPVTGDAFDIVSLGDLDQYQLNQGIPPGQITLVFSNPQDPNDLSDPSFAIRDGPGYDFAVFENGFISEFNTSGGSIAGQMFTELGYVEVSSDGTNFARFPAVSLTPAAVGAWGTIEISSVYNLAGKHPNAASICTGTPFDLAELASDPLVQVGLVDLDNIRYVRIVDIPGSGGFFDAATSHIDPNSWPDWLTYLSNHPVYDAWLTWGSGGLDLEAVGVLHGQQFSADINLDGLVNMLDFALFASAWHSRFGQPNWLKRCDLAQPADLVIDALDLAVFAEQWLGCEQWRRF